MRYKLLKGLYFKPMELIALLCAKIFVIPLTCMAQNAIPLGAGSYAEYPPLHEAEKPYYSGTDRWGDLSQKLPNMQIFVVDTNTRAVPSTDWWTTLVSTRYSDNLWAYPLMVNAEDYGFYLEFPKYWTSDGRFLFSKSRLTVSAENFIAESALARRWGAWTIDWIMNDQTDAGKSMAVTIGHGLPFVWAEYTNLSPVITVDTATVANAAYFNSNGSSITFPFIGDYFGIEIKGDYYGIFAPANTQFSLTGNQLKVKFASANGFLVIATMPSKSSLSTFYNYAYAIPRDSKVKWQYNEETAKIEIDWELITENLRGQNNLDLIQGWIPHHYKKTTRNFNFNGIEYQTPRGKMKCATGRNFRITYAFNGLIPNYPVPTDTIGVINPFRKEWIMEMINNYTAKNGYGTETYWGGKDILNYARYMQLAYQMGNTDAFEIFKKKLREALEDWYTYTPGENYHYFAWYPNWGSFMGFNTRDNENPGIDILQDHAFCYAYHVYAAALLYMYDEEFKNKYQEFTKMLVRDYANWDTNYTRLPWFRSMDPWCGHSFSGGLGDFNGNGQESSSEAMQAWGAMFLLGTVLNDKEMRDAAIFGYIQEAQAVAEYWFDRSHIPANGGDGNYDYTKYPYPYNSNLVTQGIGWWTYFSGDWFWMHAIQWLPMSPLLKYLYEDIEFARWDYHSMWTTKSLGGWDSNLGNEAGVGNIALSYLQISDPDSAAAIFDWLWMNNKTTARAPDNNAFTYWYTHAHRSLGEIQWNQWTNIPSSTVYFNSRTNKTTVVVYNPEYVDQVCKVYRNGVQFASFVVPSRQLISHQLDGSLKTIHIHAPSKTVARGGAIQFSVRCYDQYGAVVAPTITWSVSGGGTINQNGVFTAGNSNGTYTITAQSGSIVAHYIIRVGDQPTLTNINISPSISRFEIGKTYTLFARGFDQFGDSIGINPTWSVTGGGGITSDGKFTPTTAGGPYQINVTSDNVTKTLTFYVTYPLCNIALNKPVVASSEVQPNNLALKINDGDEDSRWESYANDVEWIKIDLQNTFDLEKIIIKWEAAFAKKYDILISANDINYTTIYSQENGAGGTEEIQVAGTGRYIKLATRLRGTSWANSIFEFEVYGTPQKSGSPVLTTIIVEPAIAIIKDTSKQPFTVKGFDQYGNQMLVSPQWSVIGRGNIDANGVYTPTTGSMYLESSFTVVAKANGLVNKAIVVVEEVKKLMKLDILPVSSLDKRIFIPLGTEYIFGFKGEDQFGTAYKGNLLWWVNGGGTINQNGVFKANQLGDFMVFAQSGNTIDTAFVSVRNFSDVNIALHKPVKTSSDNGQGSKGEKAVDGDSYGTRWESVHGIDPQWIAIDLKARYDLSKVVLLWETASAKSYQIQISDDNVTWTTVYSTTTSNGGHQEIPINGQGRYIRMYGTERNTGYGYSLWEFEVYAKSILSTLSRIEINPVSAVVSPSQSITFIATGFDIFGNQINFNPVWNSNKGNITANGTYSCNDPGNWKVFVKSGEITSMASVKVNKKPHINIITPENYTQYALGSKVVVSAFAYDDDGTIHRVEFREGNVILANSFVSPYNVILDNLGNGTHTIGVVAYDNDGATATASITVTVGNINNIPPAANAGEDKTIYLPANSITLMGTGTDPDGSVVSYNWAQMDGPSGAILTNANTSNVFISGLIQGIYTFRLTVTDNAGAQNSDEVKVTVLSGSVNNNLALNKPITASSVQSGLPANLANDGNLNTRWGSDWSDPQWIAIDLQAMYQINQVVLHWETASAKNYTIEVSNDNVNWTVVKSVTNSAGGTETHNLTNASGRYIRINCTARNTGWGYSLWEMEVYGTLFITKSENSLVISNLRSENSNLFHLFPNPAEKFLMIKVDENYQLQKLLLIDMNGKVLKKLNFVEVQNHQIVLNISDIKPGPYLIKLFDGVNMQTLMFLKK